MGNFLDKCFFEIEITAIGDSNKKNDEENKDYGVIFKIFFLSGVIPILTVIHGTGNIGDKKGCRI